MTRRVVTCVGVDDAGEIARLGGFWGVADVDDAVRHIGDGIHRYFVHVVPPPVEVKVVDGPDGKRLVAVSSTHANRLEALPRDCPR